MPRMHTRTLIAAILVFGSVSSKAVLADDSSAPSAPVRTLDDRLMDVARSAPSFGGMLVDAESDTLIVHVVDLSDSAEVRDAILGEFSIQELTTSRMTMVRADFSMHDLGDWYSRAREIVGIEGVVFTDLNEGLNRLQIGVSTDRGASEAAARLSKLDIPEEAVLVTPAEPIRLAGLQDRHRPLVGGLQIEFPTLSGNPGICTYGFSARHVGESHNGFVINAHCTEQFGSVDDTPYWQPVEAAENLIGHEQVDPPPFTSEEDHRCPVGSVCRYSDAAWAASTTDQVVPISQIARLPLDAGPDVWDGSSIYRVTAKGDPLQGVIVNKVGRTTGRTSGTISNTCVDAGGFFWIMLCSYAVGDMLSSGGDSGSPVFQITGAPDRFDVRLAGILWGHTLLDGVLFSPISAVESEIGELNICPPEFDC